HDRAVPSDARTSPSDTAAYPLHSCVDQYHGVKSRREETFMAKRCITLIGVLILLASVSFHAAPEPGEPVMQGGGPSAGSGQGGQGGQGRGGGGGAGGPIPSIEDRTNGMRKIDGFMPLYWDERTGSMFLEIPKLDTEILMATGLAAGLGSN